MINDSVQLLQLQLHKSDLKFVLETTDTRLVGSMLILMYLLLQMFTIVISPAPNVDLVIQYLPHY